MNLYLDENSSDPHLIKLLQRAGHKVAIPSGLGLLGASDPRHLAFCATQLYAILTGDHSDFLELHELVQATKGQHAGILVVRSDNDPVRDMKDHHIVRAIGNLEASGLAIENEYHVLNSWR